MRLLDRNHAGHELAKMLEGRWREPGVLVLAIDSGGVPVACQIASELGAPVDVFLTHTIATPGRPGAVMGTVTADGVCDLELEVLSSDPTADQWAQGLATREHRRLVEREQRYRTGRTPFEVKGRALVVADDGLTPREAMMAALRALRRYAPSAILVASVMPTAEFDDELALLTQEMVCVAATGLPWSDAQLGRVTDAEVEAALDAAAQGGRVAARAP